MTEDVARGHDSASILALPPAIAEAGIWRCKFRVDKWNRNKDFEEGYDPDDILEGEGNLLVNGGIQLMEDLLDVAGGTAYTTSANARLAVGSNAAAAAATDTILGTELTRTVASAIVSNQTVTFQATFSTDASQGAWEEAGVLNAGVAGTLLNHLVQSMGTKGAGQTWVLTMAITIS